MSTFRPPCDAFVPHDRAPEAIDLTRIPDRDLETLRTLCVRELLVRTNMRELQRGGVTAENLRALASHRRLPGSSLAEAIRRHDAGERR